jgi:hypothetical protein
MIWSASAACIAVNSGPGRHHSSDRAARGVEQGAVVWVLLGAGSLPVHNTGCHYAGSGTATVTCTAYMLRVQLGQQGTQHHCCCLITAAA